MQSSEKLGFRLRLVSVVKVTRAGCTTDRKLCKMCALLSSVALLKHMSVKCQYCKYPSVLPPIPSRVVAENSKLSLAQDGWTEQLADIIIRCYQIMSMERLFACQPVTSFTGQSMINLDL